MKINYNLYHDLCLDNLINIEELNLGRNKITHIAGLDNLKKLKKLNLQDNQISKIEYVNHLSNLEELILMNNNIRTIENIGYLLNLKKLTLTVTLLNKEDQKLYKAGSDIVKRYRAKKLDILIKRVEYLKSQLDTEGFKLDDYKAIQEQIDDVLQKIKNFS